MDNINRRQFLKTGVAGIAGLSVSSLTLSGCKAGQTVVDRQKLGKTGLSISRIGMGTGTVGYNHASNQTRLGLDNFVKLVHYGYEKGLRFFDMAESYGSHTFVGEALKTLPRDKITLCSKIWTHPSGSNEIEPVEKTLDRFRKDLGTDYIDILLMHCLMEGNWKESRKYYIDAFSKAKADGIIKAVGVSCHNWDALADAVENLWVDVILARINPFGTHMDGKPEDINGLLKRAKDNGKGVIGMKIFGEGKNASDQERQQSLEYSLKQANIHSMTIGLESIPQIDDLVDRVGAILS